MLTRSLTYQLASLADEGIRRATRIFEVRFGWNVNEIRVLRLIRDNPGITFTQLARLTRFERTATSRMLTKLTRAGLVVRAGAQEDARQYPLAASVEGLQLCRDADPLTAELEALMLKPLTDLQNREFNQALETVLAWVQDGYVKAVTERFPEALESQKKDRRTRRI
ncbi:MAG: MarR family winged helix-turn-helix transcriptional regulator [Beijerinckiaceae bacterium]